MSSVLHCLLWLGTIVPRVEDPLPERIGLSLPFTAAALGNLACPRGPAARRDRVANLLSAGFFLGGMTIYLVAVVVQLSSAR